MVPVPATAGHNDGGSHRRRGHGGPVCRRQRHIESERGLPQDWGERAVESSSSSVSMCHKLEKNCHKDAKHSLSQEATSTEQPTIALRHDARTAKKASLDALLSVNPKADVAVRSATGKDATCPQKFMDRHKGLPSVNCGTRQQLTRSSCLGEENRKTSSTAPTGLCRNLAPSPSAADSSTYTVKSVSWEQACPLKPPSACQDMVGDIDNNSSSNNSNNYTNGNNNRNRNSNNDNNGITGSTDKRVRVLCSPNAEGMTAVTTMEGFDRARSGGSGSRGRNINDRGRGYSGGSSGGGGSGDSGGGSASGGKGRGEGGSRGGGGGGREEGTRGALGWAGREHGGADSARVVGEGVDHASADSVGVMSLSEVRKIRQSLAVLRERETLSLPRRSRNRNRGRVATAHIDAIIAELIQQDLQAKGSRARGSGAGSVSGGGIGSRGGRVGSSNRGGGSGGIGCGNRGGGSGGDRGHKGAELTDAEVGSIIAHMDIDQSGEVDAQEFQLAISAAKRGKMSDARLAGYVLKADDMLRLRHLRVRDVFEMLDTDGNGTLSREELAKGLNMLSGHDRRKIIQRRQVLRERRRIRQERGERRRDKVASYLASVENPPEESPEKEPDYLPREATEESILHDMVRKISDLAGDDNDDDDDDDGDWDTPGSGCPFPSQGRRRPDDQRLKSPLAVKTNNVLVADAQLDQLREHIFLWKATVTAAAAAAMSDAADANTRTDTDENAATDTAAHDAGRLEKNVENQAAHGVARRGGVGGGEVETVIEENVLEDGRGEGSGLAPSGLDPSMRGPSGLGPSGLGPWSRERIAHSSSRDTVAKSDDAARLDGERQQPPSGGVGSGSARENTGANVGDLGEAPETKGNTENRSGNLKGTSKVPRRVRGPTTFASRGVHERKGRRRSAAITAAATEAAKLAVKMRRLVPAAAVVAAVAGRGRGRGRPLSPGARVVRTPFFSLLSSSSAVGSNARARCSPAERWMAKKPVVATARPGDNAVERPRAYDLDDRFLRAYLQRRFERERLPLLFAARSRSSRHRYTVCNAFEIAKRQGARIPPAV